MKAGASGFANMIPLESNAALFVLLLLFVVGYRYPLELVDGYP